MLLELTQESDFFLHRLLLAFSQHYSSNNSNWQVHLLSGVYINPREKLSVKKTYQNLIVNSCMLSSIGADNQISQCNHVCTLSKWPYPFIQTLCSEETCLHLEIKILWNENGAHWGATVDLQGKQNKQIN